jgi:glycosyltransferase involved in cell wall biosynthesis
MLLPDLILAILPIPRSRKVASLHNIIKEDMAYLYSKGMAKVITDTWMWALSRFVNIIYSSNYMASYYQNYLGPRHDVIIDYGIPDPIAGIIDSRDQQVFDSYKARSLTVIGAVCLVIKRKGLDQLVQALVSLPNYAVVVVGDGPEAGALRDLAIKLGVGDRFSILGFRANSSRFNRHFDIFAMVSRSEGFCLAMLEGMSCGIPVVCSRLPIYKDSISEEDVSFFDTEDISSLVDSIRKVSRATERYARASLSLYQNRFTIRSMADKHIEYYRSL